MSPLIGYQISNSQPWNHMHTNNTKGTQQVVCVCNNNNHRNKDLDLERDGAVEDLEGRGRRKLCHWILINFFKGSLSSDALFCMWFNLLRMSSAKKTDRKLVAQAPALQTLPWISIAHNIWHWSHFLLKHELGTKVRVRGLTFPIYLSTQAVHHTKTAGAHTGMRK